ncbi:MAG: hypothetical protein ACOCXX_01565, partial [Planctomycetota bacterium]
MVKEMRQVVRGRMTVALLVGVLGIGVLVLGLVAADGRAGDMGRGTGSVVLGWVYLVLGVAMWLVLPLGAAMRLVREYNPDDPDLYFHTTLSPWSIFFGKWMSTMWLGLWLLLAAMPFAWIAWFLRGLGVMSIVAVMANLWMVMGLVTGFALLVASLPVKPSGRRALLLLGAVVSGLGFAGMLLGGMVGRSMGMGMGMADWTSMTVLVTSSFSVFGMGQLGFAAGSSGPSVGGLTVGLMVPGWLLDIAFLLVLGRALLSPPQANKTVLPRMVLAGGIVACGLVAVLLTATDEMLVLWVARIVSLVGSWVAVEVSQPIRLPRRARRWLSDNPGLLRVPRLLLSQSRGLGLLFCVLLMCSIIVFVITVDVNMSSFFSSFSAESIVAGVVGYGLTMLIYALAACFIRDWVLLGWLRTSSTGLLMIGLMIVGTVMPIFAMLQVDELWYLNPWVTLAQGMDGDLDDFGMAVLGFVAAVALAINLKNLLVG